MYDVHELSLDLDADEDVTDEETWAEENLGDPYDDARILMEQERASR